MSIFKNTYSGLITNGFGLGGCCGILTMGFTLFHCKIEIINPPPGGGGGHVTVAPSIQIPWRDDERDGTKMVLITVKLSETQTWRRSFLVSDTRGVHLVKVMNIINSTNNKIKIAIDYIVDKTKATSVVVSEFINIKK